MEGQNKFSNQKLRMKPESSLSEVRTKGKAREKTGERVWGGRLVTLPRKFLKNRTWNYSFWCIFEATFEKI